MANTTYAYVIKLKTNMAKVIITTITEKKAKGLVVYNTNFKYVYICKCFGQG